MKQQMRRIMRLVGTAAAFITRPVLAGMGWVWPLRWGSSGRRCHRRQKGAVKAFSITFWLCWFAGAAWPPVAVSPRLPGSSRSDLANALDPSLSTRTKRLNRGKCPGGCHDWSCWYGVHRRGELRMATSWLMTGMIGGSSAFEDAFDISPCFPQPWASGWWLLPSCLAMGA